MKHGTKPTKEQAMIITANGLNHWEWLVERIVEKHMIIKHRVTGEFKSLEVK